MNRILLSRFPYELFKGAWLVLYRFGHLSATWLVACTSEGLLVRSGSSSSFA